MAWLSTRPWTENELIVRVRQIDDPDEVEEEDDEEEDEGLDE